jgi:hypothetical protein
VRPARRRKDIEREMEKIRRLKVFFIVISFSERSSEVVRLSRLFTTANAIQCTQSRNMMLVTALIVKIFLKHPFPQPTDRRAESPVFQPARLEAGQPESRGLE